MIPRLSDKARQRGQSFTSCLLAVVVFFGGIGFYYFKVFRWRDLEDPTINLTVVKIPPRENHVLHPFRKRTISDIIDPCRVELDNLKVQIKLTKDKKTKKYGVLIPEDWDQATTEILNRMIEIMKQAKLRRIPERYNKEYLKVLWGVHHTYRATLEFREYCSAPVENPTAKAASYKEMKKHRKKAISAFKKGREWFTHDAKSAI